MYRKVLFTAIGAGVLACALSAKAGVVVDKAPLMSGGVDYDATNHIVAGSFTLTETTTITSATVYAGMSYSTYSWNGGVSYHFYSNVANPFDLPSTEVAGGSGHATATVTNIGLLNSDTWTPLLKAQFTVPSITLAAGTYWFGYTFDLAGAPTGAVGDPYTVTSSNTGYSVSAGLNNPSSWSMNQGVLAFSLSSAASVPEAASLGLLGAGALALMTRKRSR